MADKVIFTGRVPHSDVQRYYNLVDVLVYPRLKMRLTDLVTPLKPLEAMAQGRLLVASDVGGHQELIEDGKTGVLFAAGDPLALAREDPRPARPARRAGPPCASKAAASSKMNAAGKPASRAITACTAA